MHTYCYSYKNTPIEAIGRVKASSIEEAIEMVAIIKQLPIDDVVNLFLIYKD